MRSTSRCLLQPGGVLSAQGRVALTRALNHGCFGAAYLFEA